VVLRRLECVLEPTKEKVLAEAARIKVKSPEKILERVAGQSFYNTSKLDLRRLLGDPNLLVKNLQAYIQAFSPSAQDILENFDFDEQIAKLDKHDLLYRIVGAFADIDLHPSTVSNLEMGYIFEELIRKFAERSNETAGEHFTPREVIRLMVNLVFAADRNFLKQPGIVRTLYDPACGTGGMLSVAEEYLREINPKARLVVFGQELNPESYAICKSDMMIKGQDPRHIHRGNSFSEDGESTTTFDYMLSNPPFGVDWKKVKAVVEKEHKTKGFDGRFGAGLPRIKDGALLFLQHMISKMKPSNGGSRLAIVFNASPLFTGAAESGESKIRRWIIENDMLEAVVGLPDELFYNTGIHTYVWVVTNRKESRRRGHVQLIDGRQFYRKMNKSLGNKRNELQPEHIEAITRLYVDFAENERSRILPNQGLGYRRVPIERPLRLRYEITAERVALLRAKLGRTRRSARRTTAAASWATRKRVRAADPREVVERLAKLVGTRDTDRAAFEATLQREVFAQAGKVTARVRRLVLEAATVRDPSAPPVTNSDGRPQSDTQLRAYEDVPLAEDEVSYFAREVQPHAPDAWLGPVKKPKVGYEIPFRRLFYRYEVPPSLPELQAQVRRLEDEIVTLLRRFAQGQQSERPYVASPITWAPTLPDGWRAARLRYIAELGSGHTPSRKRPEWWADPTIPWITTSDVHKFRDDRLEVLQDTEHKITEVGLANSAAVLHPAGTVVLSRTASVGFSVIMGRAMATSQDFATWTCSDVLLPSYLLYCLRAMRPDLLGRLSQGSTHQTIYMPDIESLMIPLPSLDEQRVIVDEIRRLVDPIDRLTEALGVQLPRLAEYRRALLAEAVTGRLVAGALGKITARELAPA
jgi:type I restriction enzyme M protein